MHSNEAVNDYIAGGYDNDGLSDDIELTAFIDDNDLSEYEGRIGARSIRQHRADDGALNAYTAMEERTVLRKLDRHLVFFLSILYMLSFLDRSNIGNAKIAGLTDDLQLSSDQYEWVLTAFYITYILFEWMTLLYRVVPPHIYIALCVAAWGLIASLQSLATSFTSLITLRALLGISEAAFGPGVPFYLSFFYRREELAFRTGLFISAAPLATSFASSLAWLIVKIGNYGPISPWRLLFLVEGFPSVIVAFFAWLYIPDSPKTANFLNANEKKIAEHRLLDSNTRSGKSRITGKPQLQWKEIGRTMLDPKSYITAMMFFSCNVAFSSLPPFLPTIIKDMHYSPLLSQALSAPPYLVAFVVVILTTWASDKRGSRSPFLIFHSILGSLGYAWLALSGHLRWPSIVRYAGTFAAAAGFFSAVALTITWTMDNRRAAEGKGTGVALLNIVGQLGPLVGTRLYPKNDAPYYVKGMSICAAFMLAVGVLTILLRYILRRENLHTEGESVYEILREGNESETAEYERTKHRPRLNKVVNIL